MIGKIKGTVEHLHEDHLIIDNHGIGYIVYCSSRTLICTQVGDISSLFIQMVIKEDQMSLYGFLNQEDKDCFNLLQTVQGVGAKVALNIQSHLTNHDIYASVMSQDTTSFRQVSGIGPKLAERLVNELKSSKQLSCISNFKTFPANSATIPGKEPMAVNQANILNDAVSALIALGYNRKDAFITVQEFVLINENLSIEEIIKLSLKKISGI
jgi:holliday junction DNA helicase RuvA